jgi:hypothetical protein
METVVLLLLFGWLISTVIMTARTGAELRKRDAAFSPREISAATTPMRTLSTPETGEMAR